MRDRPGAIARTSTAAKGPRIAPSPTPTIAIGSALALRNVGAFATAYNAVRRGGTVVSVGLVDPKTPFPLDVASLVTSAKTVKGSYMGSCNPPLDLPRYAGLFAQGHFPVEKLISHHLPLGDINLALDRMAANEALRQIITPHRA